MNKFRMFVVGLLAFSASLAVNAQVVETKAVPGVVAYNTEDTPCVYRIKYNGSSTATITNSATVITVVDGGNSTAITITGNAGATLASIAAVTNTSGVANFQVELLNSLAADTVSNVLLATAATVNLADGKWHEVVKWDTSACLHFDTCSYGDGASQRWLNTIYGQPGGTGNLTLNVYVDGTEVYRKLILAPFYTQGAIVAGTNASVTVQDIAVLENIGQETTYGILIPAKSKCLIRATRATTATTGGIGGLITSR